MNTKTFRRFKEMLKPYWKTVLIIMLISIVIDAVEIIKPYLIQQVIDNYLKNKTYVYNNISISNIACIYIFLVAFGNIIDFLNRSASFKLGEKVIYDLRIKLFKFIEKANFRFHDKTLSGELYVRLTSDTETVYSLFAEVIVTLLKDTLIIIGLIAAMIYISTQLSIITFVMMFFVGLTIIIITKKMNDIFDKSKIARTKLNSFIAESIYGAKLIKIFNRQDIEQKECKKRTKDMVYAGRNLGGYLGVLPGIIDTIEKLAISWVVVFCCYQLMGVSLDIGIIYLFITYMTKIVNPINRVIEKLEVVTDAFSSIDRIYDILDQEEVQEDFETGQVLKDIKGKIEFKNVWFAYKDEEWILKDVSFTINPGESIALVGKTGSGKTTIVSLISRFYDIQKGEILIDGINIKDINLKSLRSNIGTILQDPFIFARSIKDNIKLYSDIEDDEIEKAIKISSADHFIKTLPKGINEIASERGNSYSAGQKQLLAFARIFAKDPAILILDEATANIDTMTEELIQKSIDTLLNRKTAIFIAHRLSTIVNVDEIIVLDGGTIIEQGSHKELLKKGGYYAKLYNVNVNKGEK